MKILILAFSRNFVAYCLAAELPFFGDRVLPVAGKQHVAPKFSKFFEVSNNNKWRERFELSFAEKCGNVPEMKFFVPRLKSVKRKKNMELSRKHWIGNSFEKKNRHTSFLSCANCCDSFRHNQSHYNRKVTELSSAPRKTLIHRKTSLTKISRVKISGDCSKIANG